MKVRELRELLANLPLGSDGWEVLVLPEGEGCDLVHSVEAVSAERYVEYSGTVYFDPEDAGYAEADDEARDMERSDYEAYAQDAAECFRAASRPCALLYGRYFHG